MFMNDLFFYMENKSEAKKMSVSEDELMWLIKLLEKRGWKPQNSSYSYMNGVLGINLLKNGEILSILAEKMPDEECLQEIFREVEEL